MSQVDSFLAGSSLPSRAAYQFVRAIMVLVCRVWCRMSIEGREHIPTTGAFVLAPIHRSIIDSPVSSCLTRRRMRFMGKDTMWKNRSFGWLLSALGGFPVTRGTADREALTRCIQVLQNGEPLVVFPEGERKSGPIVQPLFEGASYVAVKAGVPIVPVGIGGSERVMPKHSKFVWPHKMHAIVGPPILVPNDAAAGGRAPRAVVRETTAQLHAELQRLFDAAQARVG
jgi:1-acyl-sn-glycerol-3-phosphate acyltransferase